MIRSITAVAFAAVTLSGCATSPVSDDQAGPFPTDYHAVVEQQVKADFFDPFSLQDVWIATPYKARFFFQEGWMVCLRANGKNRNGAYAGRQETGFLIHDDTVTLEGDHIGCPDAQYTEWTDLENLGAKR